MKTFVVVLAVLSVLGVTLVKGFDKKAAIADFMAKADVCKGEVGATEADVADAAAKKPASSPEGKCLRSCLMKKYGLMDANGKLVKEVAVKHAEMITDGAADKMKIANEILDACLGLDVSSDHCEAADQYCKCLKDQETARSITDFDM